MNKIFDIIGIGFGPANIALAIAIEESDLNAEVLFLEKNSNSKWQPNMQIPGADIQNNPLRDLVTPRNPRSKYTFVNYLHQCGRLFEHLNLPLAHPLRLEYSMYIEWVAQQFQHQVKYNTNVTKIEIHTKNKEALYKISDADNNVYFARSLVVAPGRTANIPALFSSHIGNRVFHLNDYTQKLNMITQQDQQQRFCIVGSSQSAVEIALHLHSTLPDCEIIISTRNLGFRLKDTSPFSEKVYFPEFTDYFYSLPEIIKKKVANELRSTNYSSADRDVIDQLYVKMYEDKLQGNERITLHSYSNVKSVNATEDQVELQFQNTHTGKLTSQTVSGVILATGFKDLGFSLHHEKYPSLLKEIAPLVKTDQNQVLKVHEDYSLHPKEDHWQVPPVYLNGLSESSHGLGDAGSLSLLSLRSEKIVNSLSSCIGFNEAMQRTAA